MRAISYTTALHVCAFECRFTGKERDTESGLDYFGARYYGSTMGRWMSPDWSKGPTAVPYANLPNPQTLNLYAYVSNNPLSRADADGHFWRELWNAIVTGCGCWTKSRDTANLRAYINDQAIQEKYAPPPGQHYRVTVGIVYPIGSLFGGAAAGAAGAGEAAEGAGWVRVGRWMSQAELEAMKETGLAQEGSGGASRVAEPSNPDAYKAAPAGDVYVEYDVPSGSTKPDGTGGQGS